MYLSVGMIIPEHESSADINETALGIVSKRESLFESLEVRTRLLAILLGFDWCTLGAGGLPFVFRVILGSVILIPSWAILTLEGSHRVRAFAFAVAAAVVARALVHV